MKTRRLSTFFAWFFSSSPTRYWMRLGLSHATLSIGPMFPGRTWPTMSNQEPFLRNFGLNVANGPNSSEASPSTTRVSRCGTDMGGAPTDACDDTLGLFCCSRAGVVVLSLVPALWYTPVAVSYQTA